MPTNKQLRTTGVTVHAHQGLTPTRRQQERQELIRQTASLINAMVGAYMKEHSKDNPWATPVRVYYECLLNGRRMPAGIRLEPDTRQLVKSWATEAARQTGYQIPPQPALPKRKKR